MAGAIVGPLPALSLQRCCVLGQGNGKERIFGCRLVKLRRRVSRWTGERVQTTFVEKFEERGLRKGRSAGLVTAMLVETGSSSWPNVAVLMEVEGVLADVHRFGHRQGFNLAFQEMGLDCAQWSEAVFTDLQRATGGVEETMVSSFFNRASAFGRLIFSYGMFGGQTGWPTALPTNEQEAFLQKVLQVKNQALEKLVQSNDIPLRPGLDKFVDEIMEANVPLVILAAHYKGGEQFARLLVEKLGKGRAGRMRFVGEADLQNSAYGQLVLGEGATSSLDEQLAVAASKAVAAEKQRIAEEVASLLKLSVEIDTSFTQTSKKAIAVLRAGAEIGEVDVDRCILLASGLPGLQAANCIDMPCVVIRSSSTARGEFPTAKAVLDGYGPGSATLSRLLKFL